MKTIKLDHITKIEGHAELIIKVDNHKVKKAALNVLEGARFFESIVKGRYYNEAHILTSRICGTCSPIHTITSLKTVENAFNIQVSEQTNLLREALVLGSMVQNHAVHLYFLALPDYLGFDGALAMAEKHRPYIERALRLKSIGNRIVNVIGGREVHPVTPVVGGFSKLPDRQEFIILIEDLKNAKKDALLTVELFKSLGIPKFERETRYMALENSRYDFLNGAIKCEGNMCIPVSSYTEHFKEYIQARSFAKPVVIEGRSYMVGALARLNNNYKKLSKDALAQISFKIPCYNPFYNNLAQAIEIVHCIDRTIEILSNVSLKKEELPRILPKKARGIGVTEAPRGLLFHDYEFDAKGIIQKANIITPTAQNLRNIEDDIKVFLPKILNKNEGDIKMDIEKLIRAYDPCFSCSAHFLRIRWE